MRFNIDRLETRQDMGDYVFSLIIICALAAVVGLGIGYVVFDSFDALVRVLMAFFEGVTR